LSDPLSVGLIGCGWIADLAHIPSLERSRIARLDAVAEADAERRTWVGHRLPSVRLVEEGVELLQDATVQAVVIALPTAVAAPLAEAAFRAGKHVYVEKPGAPSADEWQSVVDAWQQSETTGVVGYNFRHNPIYLDAVRRVREGTIGRVVAVQSRFTWAADGVEGWRATTATGGGTLLDLASHHVDLASQLLDDRVAEVRCVTRSVRTEEDTASISLDFQEGVNGQVQVTSAGGANENRLTLIGSDGVLDVDLLDARPAQVRQRAGRLERVQRSVRALRGLHPARLLRSPGQEPSFETALGMFLDGIVRGHRVRPDPADGMQVLRVIDAARTSAGTGGAPVAVVSDAQ